MDLVIIGTRNGIFYEKFAFEMDQLERSMTRPSAECNPTEFVNQLEQFLLSEKSATSSKLVGELRITGSYTFLFLTGIRL
jgi:hypothetical protein